MEWKIDENLPIWSQLCEQITAEIIAGRYPPASRLPSVRDLAAEAGVNPNTMQRALSELESRGVIRTNRTAGRSVSSDTEAIERLRREKGAQETAAFLCSMRKLGYADEEIRRLLEASLSEEPGTEAEIR